MANLMCFSCANVFLIYRVTGKTCAKLQHVINTPKANTFSRIQKISKMDSFRDFNTLKLRKSF